MFLKSLILSPQTGRLLGSAEKRELERSGVELSIIYQQFNLCALWLKSS